jgi:hypothetical protein
MLACIAGGYARAARRLFRPQGPDRIDVRRASSRQERRERGEDEHG